MFTCKVDEKGNISKVDTFGNPTEYIGVSIAAYEGIKRELDETNSVLAEAIEKAEEVKLKKDEYEKILVDNGLIQLPKTQEEIMAEMLANNQKLMEMNMKLMAKMEYMDKEMGGMKDELERFSKFRKELTDE